MIFFRRRQAKKYGVPFTEEKYWPPYYLSFHGKRGLGEDVSALPDIYNFTIGQVAPVFKSATETHFYKITSMSLAPGDDHIVSPLQFDIKYHHSTSCLAKAA